MFPCESKAGFFYTRGAVGGETDCANVRARCSNARAGEEYVLPPQHHVVVNSTGCPVRSCGPAPVGRYYAIEGSCAGNALHECVLTDLGKYFVDSGAPCQQADCTNAEVGQYYTTRFVGCSHHAREPFVNISCIHIWMGVFFLVVLRVVCALILHQFDQDRPQH